MQANAYEVLQSHAADRGLEPLPDWKDIDAETQQVAFRVLRRLTLARALKASDGVSALEATAGIGEDVALRVHLLLTCVHALGRIGAVADGAGTGTGNGSKASRKRGKKSEATDPFARFFEHVLGDQDREWMVANCWVYADDPLEAWAGLPQVESGFSESRTERLDRLGAARARWDELDDGARVGAIANALRAVMHQYLVGRTPYPRTTQTIWGDPKVIRGIREAARADRLSLLSDTAFDAFVDQELPSESFRGVRILVKDGEGFLRRSALKDVSIDEWSTALAQWDPVGSAEGDALFAWDDGVALAIPSRTAPGQLELWVEAGLAKFIHAKAALAA